MRRYALFALLGVVACGDDAPVSHLDAGSGDDSHVIDVDSGPTQPVSITVTIGGQPNAGVTVYFQNADSTLVATKTTDATGTASALMNAGGYVTAVDPFEVAAGLPTKIVRTFAGVKEGDHLLLDEPTDPTQISIIFQGPVYNNVLLRSYTITPSCGPSLTMNPQPGPTGDKSAHGTLTLYGCGAQADFHVVAKDISGDVLVSQFTAGQPITANATIDTSEAGFSNAPQRMYTLTNVPNTVGQFTFTDHQLSTLAWGAQPGARAPGAGTGTTTLAMKVPTFTNATSMIEAVATANRNRHTLLSWGPFAATYTSDAGTRVLKAFASDPAYSAATHAVSWTESANGASPDFVHLLANGIRGNEGFYIDWQMVAPYSEGTATLPTLPPGMYDLNFADTDSIELGVRQYKVPGGFDATRASFFISQSLPAATGEASSVEHEPPIQARTQATMPHATFSSWFVRASH